MMQAAGPQAAPGFQKQIVRGVLKSEQYMLWVEIWGLTQNVYKLRKCT